MSNIALSWVISLADAYLITTMVWHAWATSATCFAVWMTLPERILQCTDPFIEPPIPSTTPFPCEVVKECHFNLYKSSFSQCSKFEDRYFCLNWDGPLEKKWTFSMGVIIFPKQIVRWSGHTYAMPLCHDLSN